MNFIYQIIYESISLSEPLSFEIQYNRFIANKQAIHSFMHSLL